MPKKLTEQEKAEQDKRRAEQADRNKGKRRIEFIIGVQKDPENPEVLKIVVPLTEGITNAREIGNYMEKMNIVGTIYPARLSLPVTRFEQRKMRTVIGGKEGGK